MLTNGKTSHKAKTSSSDFQITTPKNPLIKNQGVTSIRNLTTILVYPKISAYSWAFTPISNWTWSYRDFFLYTNLSTRLNFQQLMFVVRCKVLYFNTRWRFGSTWLQNPKVYKNTIASPKVYVFSNLSLYIFDDF